MALPFDIKTKVLKRIRKLNTKAIKKTNTIVYRQEDKTIIFTIKGKPVKGTGILDRTDDRLSVGDNFYSVLLIVGLMEIITGKKAQVTRNDNECITWILQ